MWWPPSALLQIKVALDDRCPKRVHVYGGLLRPCDALGAGQQVLLKRGQFGFVYDDSKVVALQIVIGTLSPVRVSAARTFG